MANVRPTENAENLTADDQVAKIFEWRRGFNALHLISLGVQMGLFRELANTPDITAAQLAANTALHPPYIDTWCTTAYSFGLLEGTEDRVFRLAPHMADILGDPDHPRYLGGYARLGTEFATEDRRYCVEAFMTGGTNPFQGRSAAFAEIIAESTAGLQVLSARKLLPALPGLKERLAGGESIVEVGCGTGRHLLQMAKVFPSAKCIGVDIDPTGIEMARNLINNAGVGARVSAIEGSLGAAIAKGTADCVVMIEVLHEIAADLRQNVIDACYRVLRPGGWLMIIDETYPSTLAETRQAAYLFPIQTGFEELTWGNIVPTREEQESLLRNAGFDDDIGRSLIGGGFTVLTVQKTA